MRTHCAKIVLILLSVLWLSAAQSQHLQSVAHESPLASVTALHEALVAAAHAEPTSVRQRYQRLAPVISATHDLPFIARFATRRYWDDFDLEQRDVFVEQFSRLSGMTYAARFASVSADTFSVKQTEVQESGRVQVLATIRRDAQPDIPIEYLLHETSAGWKIINVIADGVSDLALKRAEYRAAIEAGGIEELLGDIEERLAAFQETSPANAISRD